MSYEVFTLMTGMIVVFVPMRQEKELVTVLRNLAEVEQLSLLRHDGEVRF